MEKEFSDFENRVVLVTGSSKGIGREIAIRFAASGARVAIHSLADRQAAEDAARKIIRDGGQSFVFQADVTHEDETNRLIQQVVGHFGRLDILVNNAGQYHLLDPLVEIPARDWERIINTNLTSVFLCTKSAGQQMIHQGDGGAIINIASIEANAPMPGHSHYDAAKAGVIMLTRSSALELGEHGIRVNAISPGLIWRENIEQDWPQGVERWKTSAPLKRLGTPGDIARSCLFLASPAAGWITGINLVVDGGVSVRSAF